MAEVNFDSMTDDSVQPAEPAGSFDQLKDDSETYGGTGQTIQAGLEGALRGAITAPGAALVEKGLGLASPEGIRGRQEQHPIASGVGEAATLVGGALTGTGESALLSKAGELAAEGVGLAKPVSYAARIGSNAVKQAAELGAYQALDETSRAMLQDPNLSAESAISNIGLATALGGAGGAAFSAVSPLWSATVGPKATEAFKALTSHLGGIEGDGVTRAADLEAIHGVSIAPELKGVIDDLPGFRENHSILSQSDTTMAGRSYQKGLEDLHNNLGAKVIESLGKDPSTIENLPELDKYNTGRDMGETLRSEIKPVINDISSRYDKINDEFKQSPLTDNDRRMIADQIAQKSMEQGWNKASSVTSDHILAEKVLKDMPSQETAADLKQFITNLRNAHPYGSDTYQAAKQIANVLKDNQERIVSENVARSGGDAQTKLNEYNKLKKDYSGMMNQLDALNEHLHVGRYDGPQSFMQALSDLSANNGEAVLNRLSGTSKADVLEQLKSFPKTLEKVKDYHVNKLLDEAVKKAPPGANISLNNLVKKTNEASPQIKQLIASPEQHAAIQAVGDTLEGLKDPNHNFSNTARTAAKLLHGTPSALSLLAALTGHTGAGILSFLGKLGFTEGKDALKLGMMKFLSSDQPVKAEGFKSMVSFLNASRKGMQTLDKAAENVLKPGVKVLLPTQMPSETNIEKLDKLVASNNPKETDQEMDAQNNGVGHYMPDHQTALTQANLAGLQYLKSIKPQSTPAGPLNKPMLPSPAQEARYRRALEIAEQPGVVMQHIKDGSLQVTDVQDLKAMYPSVYQALAQTLSNRMISRHEEGAIPYKTQIGLSLFLGQPVNATMEPTSIQAAQSTYIKPAPQPPPQGKTKKGTSTLGKSNSSYRTPNQTAEADQSKRD